MVSLPPKEVTVLRPHEYPKELTEAITKIAEISSAFLSSAGDPMWEAVLRDFQQETGITVDLNSHPAFRKLFEAGLKSGFFNAMMVVNGYKP